MVKFKGLGVYVKSGGQELPEFEIPSEDQINTNDTTLTIERYIEAEADQFFEVNVQVDTANPSLASCIGLSLAIYVDGVKQEQGNFNFSKICAIVFDDRRYTEDGVSYKQKIKLGNLQSGDGQSASDIGPASLDNLGAIEILVRPVSSITTYERSYTLHKATVGGPGIVPESALKGSSKTLVASYGPAAETTSSSYTSSIKIDSAKQPYARIVFHYRSGAALRCLGVIPRTPSPEREVPLTERDPNTLSQAELLGLVMILKDENKKHKQAISKIESFRRLLNQEIGVGIKRELSDDGVDDASLFQAERPSKRPSRGREVIELNV